MSSRPPGNHTRQGMIGLANLVLRSRGVVDVGRSPKLIELGLDLFELEGQLVELLHDRVLSGGSPQDLRAGHEATRIAAVTTEIRDRPPSIRKHPMILPTVWLGTMSP